MPTSQPMPTYQPLPDHSAMDLSWADYALDGRKHPNYWETERYRASFPPGSFVVDVGCGDGAMLKDVMSRGCRGIGTEVHPELVERTRARGVDAELAPAEALPVPTGSADGVIFAGVLPFTDEDKAFSEITRVLRRGGRVEAYYLGPGFGLRELLLNRNLKRRYYGARGLVNTVLRTLIGRRLPGKYGNVVFATHARMAELYARYGLTLRTHTPSPTFLGLPVFIYHSAERT